MTQYRKRPRIVEAFHWEPAITTMEGKHPIPEWISDYKVLGDHLMVYSSGLGMLEVWPKDWIVKDGKYLWVMNEIAFESAYEAVK